jgi:hypothetical protein
VSSVTTTTTTRGTDASGAPRVGPVAARGSARRAVGGPVPPARLLAGGAARRSATLLPAVLVFGAALAAGAAPCRAESGAPAAEPTREACVAAVDAARALAAALPEDDLSRRFAERDLEQALVEAGNGEFDDCLELAARASEEIRGRHHCLAPGETLEVRRADE